VTFELQPRARRRGLGGAAQQRGKVRLYNDLTFTRERQAYRSSRQGAAHAGECRRQCGRPRARNGRWGKARRRSAGETASYAVRGTAVIRGTEASIVTVSRDAVVLEFRLSSPRCCSLGVVGRGVRRQRVGPPSSAAVVRGGHGLERKDGRGTARRDRRRERFTASPFVAAVQVRGAALPEGKT
jgi:hypothetical protein